MIADHYLSYLEVTVSSEYITTSCEHRHTAISNIRRRSFIASVHKLHGQPIEYMLPTHSAVCSRLRLAGKKTTISIGSRQI